MIIKCNCNHKFQDKTYGAGKRVMNKTQKTIGTSPVYRCTVCTTERTADGKDTKRG